MRAAEITSIYRPLIDAMPWPLFLTLTMTHNRSDDLVENVTILRGAWRKFRSLKWFKKCCNGGVCAVEISSPNDDNGGFELWGDNGAHPHIHALLDCRWLMVSGGRPQGRAGTAAFKKRVTEIQSEIAEQWTLCLGGKKGGVFTRRAKKNSVSEVLKYAVSSDALLNEKVAIEPVIKALSGRKAVMPWGSIRKALKIVKAEHEAARKPLVCECGAESWGLDPMSAKETLTVEGRWLTKNGQFAKFVPWR